MLPRNWKQFAVIHDGERQKQKAPCRVRRKPSTVVMLRRHVGRLSGHINRYSFRPVCFTSGRYWGNSDGDAADSISLSFRLPGERLQSTTSTETMASPDYLDGFKHSHYACACAT
uniref:Uncharacterized protein n=1 Tax=Salmonella sp. TaxID=599 RepID=A0A482ETM1_SALSP|nr:hypothetical protein [Salmonella sp.]QBM91461.1 hypothetical protein NNIBIDOC_00132 [Salmonella sp.]